MNYPIATMISCALFTSILTIAGCSDGPSTAQTETQSADNLAAKTTSTAAPQDASGNQYDNIYVPVELTADLSHLSVGQRKMVVKLIAATAIMDDLFWKQSFGDKNTLLNTIKDPKLRRFAEINYGPWDRLNGNKSFIKNYGDKAAGAAFYPVDMTKEEFEAWDEPQKRGLYSVVQRNAAGNLTLLKYSALYKTELTRAATLLKEAAALAEDRDFANYLQLRAQALLSDNYQPSDMAWMDMKNNPVDVVIGPIENYEDKLFNYRAAFEGYVLIKDLAWSKKLARFAQFLPGLQRDLPVDAAYKSEIPGTDSDLNAYDVIYYAGDCNAGSKTIAINLPNDEEVQLSKGTRRLQLKNAMKAKFDKILLPISQVLIAQDQRHHITFDAFFANTMFHEVAHGLGIKKTLQTGEPVRRALKEASSALEEGKADILGLYMVTKLFEQGEFKQGELMDNYVTFLASIFRSIRFGAASAHGKANMVRFNFFQKAGAFERDPNTGLYRIHFNLTQQAIADLSRLILTLQGDGDYQAAKRLLADQGVIFSGLQTDLDRLTAANIPVDVTFIQGKKTLGLDKLEVSDAQIGK